MQALSSCALIEAAGSSVFLPLCPFSDFPVYPHGGIPPWMSEKPPHALSNPFYLLIFPPAPAYHASYLLYFVLHSLPPTLQLELILHSAPPSASHSIPTRQMLPL